MLVGATSASRSSAAAVESDLAPFVLATIHPSAIFRADEADRESELQAFIDDLRVAAGLLG